MKSKLQQKVRFIFRALVKLHPSSMLVAFGLISLVIMSLMSLAVTRVVLGDGVDNRAMDRLGRNIAIIQQGLHYYGAVQLKDPHLVAGDVVLDANEAFVDKMSSMLGGDIAIFRGDVQVATTIRRNGQRAVGTSLAPGPIHDAIFKHNQAYRGRENVVGTDYYVAYDPLRAPDGRVIGAVFSGLSRFAFRDLVVKLQRNIAFASVALLILTAFAFITIARPLKREIDDRESSLKRLADRFDVALENISDGLCLYASDHRLIVSNARYATMYGIESAHIVPGMTLAEVFALRESAGSLAIGYDAEAALTSHRHLFAGHRSSKFIIRTEQGRILAVHHQCLASGGWVATHSDVTLQMRDQERMRFLALHDPLTGLANRTAFNSAMLACLERLGRVSSFALFLIDLDRFKEINDAFGHSAGDAVLCEVSVRLRHLAPDAVVTARLAGDEFTLLIESASELGSPPLIAQNIVAALTTPFIFESTTILIGASIGITVVVNALLTPDEVFRQADLALYKAKARGRGVFEVFRPELAVAEQRHKELTAELLVALDNDEFILYYQPQYAVASGALLGFEALIRWQHPSRGLLDPGYFIAVAEETGLIVRLGAWVIGEACRAANSWGGDIRVAVNVSAVQLCQKSFVADTIVTLGEIGFRPDLLEVEVTETVLLEDTPEIVNALTALRRAGVRVALDDFGTGYSSLLYLRRLPFDCIKIDQAFVGDLETSPDAASIVATIIQLARSFRATTIAEGVEEPGQLAQLRSLGCDIAQGSHFSRPLPLEAALQLIAAGSCHAKGELVRKTPLHLRLI